MLWCFYFLLFHDYSFLYSNYKLLDTRRRYSLSVYWSLGLNPASKVDSFSTISVVVFIFQSFLTRRSDFDTKTQWGVKGIERKELMCLFCLKELENISSGANFHGIIQRLFFWKAYSLMGKLKQRWVLRGSTFQHSTFLKQFSTYSCNRNEKRNAGRLMTQWTLTPVVLHRLVQQIS